MPKLVLVTHIYPSWRSAPFGPHYLGWPVEAARLMGFDVDVLTTDYTIPRMAAGYAVSTEPTEETTDGVRIRRFPLLTKNRFLSPGLMNAVMNVRADVVAIHSYGYWYTEAAWAACTARRIPILFTPYFHASNRRLRHIYDRTLGRMIFNGAAAVHLFTEHSRTTLHEIGVDRSRCHVIPLPLNPETFRVLSNHVSYDGVRSRELVILGVGGLIPRKGWEYSIRSLSLIKRVVPEARLSILGYSAASTEVYLGSLRQLIADLNLTDSVTITLDPLPTELAKAYRDATMFTFASGVESFGLVLLEAMAAGLAVVANAASGLDELVPAGQAGYVVDVRQTAEYAESLATVLVDQPVRRKLAAAAREHVKAHFSTSALTPRLQELIEDVMGRKTRA